MAAEADILAPTCETRGEQGGNLADQAANVLFNKLQSQVDTHIGLPTVEGENFLRPPSIDEVQCEANYNAPDVSKVTEKPNQTVNYDNDVLLASHKLDANEETFSGGIPQNVEESKGASKEVSVEFKTMSVLEGEELNVQVKTTEEDIMCNPTRDVFKGECDQHKMTSEQEGIGNERNSEDNKEAEVFKSEKNTSTTLKEDPAESLLEAPENIEASKLGQENNTKCSPEDQSTNRDLHENTGGVTKEKPIDATDKQKDILESFTTVDSSSSKQSIRAVPQEVSSDLTDENIIGEVDTQKVLEKSSTVSNEDVQGNSVIKLDSSETKDEENEAQIEDAEPRKAAFCENERSIENMIESQTDKSEDFLHVISVDTTASGLGLETETRSSIEEQTATTHPQGNLDERTEVGTVNAAETKEETLLVQKEKQGANLANQATNGSVKELPTEEHRPQPDTHNELPTVEGENFSRTPLIGEAHCEVNNNAADGNKVTEEKIIDEADTQKEVLENFSNEDVEGNAVIKSDGSETKNNENEARIKDEGPEEAALCQNEKSTESVVLELESRIEKSEDSLPVISENFKASDVDQGIETRSSIEKQRVPTDPEGILEEKTDNEVVESAEIKEETLVLQNVPTIVPNDELEENSDIQVDAPKMENEDRLKKDTEQSSLAEDSPGNIVTDEIKVKHENPSKAETFEEKNAESALLKEKMQNEKPVVPSHAALDNIKASDLDQHTERPSLAEGSVEDLVVSDNKIDETDTNEEVPLEVQNVTAEIPRERTEENSVALVDCSHMEHEEHLQRDTENSSLTEVPLEETNTEESTNIHELKNKGIDQIKAELENEENTECTSVKEEAQEEKPINSMQAAPEDIKASDSIQGTNSSINEQTYTEYLQEISSDKTEREYTYATNMNEESLEGIATNIPYGENEHNSPVEEDNSQMPSLEESTTGKRNDEESKVVHEAELAGENEKNTECTDLVKEDVSIESLQAAAQDIKASAIGQDRKTSSLEEQNLTANPQGNMDDPKEDKTSDETGAAEETLKDQQDIAKTAPYDDIEKNLLLQVDQSRGEQNEDLENESENTSSAEALKGVTPEGTWNKEEAQVEKSIDSLQVSTRDIKASASCQETSFIEEKILTAYPQDFSCDRIEKKTIDAAYTEKENIEDAAINVPNGDDEDKSPIEVYGSKKPASEEASTGNTNDDESIIPQEPKFADESIVKAGSFGNEKIDGCILVKEEVSVKSLEVKNDIKKNVSSQDGEISHLEERQLIPDPNGIKGDRPEEKTIDVTELKKETPEEKNSTIEISHGRTEENSVTQVNCSQTEHEERLEEDSENSFLKEASAEENIADDSKDIHEFKNKGIDSVNAEMENEENRESTSMKEKVQQEKPIDSLQADPEDIKASDSSQDTNISVEERNLTAYPQEISSDKTEKESIDAADRSEERLEGIATNIPDKEDSLPIEEGDSQNPSSKEATVGNNNDEESTVTSEAKFVAENDKNTESNLINEEASIESSEVAARDIKASALGQDKETSSLEVQSLTTNFQGIIDDAKEDRSQRTSDSNSAEGETPEDKQNIAKTMYEEIGENLVVQVDCSGLEQNEVLESESEKRYLTEAPKEDVSLKAQSEDNEDKSPIEVSDSQIPYLGKEEVSAKSFQVENEDIGATASSQDREAIHLEDQCQIKNPQGIMDDQKEDKIFDSYATTSYEDIKESTLIQEDCSNLQQNENSEKDGENTSLAEAPTEDTTESTLVNEEAQVEDHIESLQVASEDNKAIAPCQESETSSTEEKILTVDPEDISRNKIFEKTEVQDVAKDVPQGDDGDYLLTEEDGSKKPSLEETSTEDAKYHESATTQQTKFVESLIKAHCFEKEKITEGIFVKEDASLESPQLAPEDIEASNSSDGRETNSLEEQILSLNPVGLVDEGKQNKTIDLTDQQKETPKDEILPNNENENISDIANLESKVPERKNDHTAVEEEKSCDEKKATEELGVIDDVIPTNKTLAETDLRGSTEAEVQVADGEKAELVQQDPETEIDQKGIEEQLLTNASQVVIEAEGLSHEEEKTNSENCKEVSGSASSVALEEVLSSNVGLKEDTMSNSFQEYNIEIREAAENEEAQEQEEELHVSTLGQDSSMEKIEKDIQARAASAKDSDIAPEMKEREEPPLSASDENIIGTSECKENEVVENAIENKEEDDRTKSVLDSKKATGKEQEEIESRQKEEKLDENVEATESTSVVIANDFIPILPSENSKEDHSTTKSEATQDREELHIAKTALNVNEETKIDDSRSVTELESKANDDAPDIIERTATARGSQDVESMSVKETFALTFQSGRDGEQANIGSLTEKKSDANEVAFETEQKSEYESKNQVLESVAQDQGSETISKIEEKITEENNLEAPTEIKYGEVVSDGIVEQEETTYEKEIIESNNSREKIKEKDEEAEDYHRGGCEEEIITESHLEGEVHKEIEIVDIEARGIELDEEGGYLKDTTTSVNIAAHEEKDTNSIAAKNPCANLDGNEDVVGHLSEDPSCKQEVSSAKVSEGHMIKSNENENISEIITLESEVPEKKNDHTVIEEENSCIEKKDTDELGVTDDVIPTNETLAEPFPRESTEAEVQVPDREKAELVQQNPETETDQKGIEEQLLISSSQVVSESEMVNDEEEKTKSDNCNEVSGSSSSVALEEDMSNSIQESKREMRKEVENGEAQEQEEELHVSAISQDSSMEKVEKDIQEFVASASDSKITREIQELEEPSLPANIRGTTECEENEVVENALKNEEIESKQEEPLAENVEIAVSMPVAVVDDLIPTFPSKTSKEDRFITESEVTQDKEELNAGKTASDGNEETKIDNNKSAADLEYKINDEAPDIIQTTAAAGEGQDAENTGVGETSTLISEYGRDGYEHADICSLTEERSDSNEVTFETGEQKSECESKTEVLESVSQVQSCETISEREEIISERKNLEAAAEIKSGEVVSKDIFEQEEITYEKEIVEDTILQEKNKEKDEDREDYHRGFCENEVITESHLEEKVKQEEITKEKLVEVIKTENETKIVPKISEVADDKAPKVPEQNFLASESVNRSLQEQEKLKSVVTSILDTEEAHGSKITCVKTGTRDSNEENKEKDEDIEDFHRGLCENEVITESHLEEEVKQEEEITKEKLVEVVKTENETKIVPKISEEADDKAPKVPEQNFLASESVNRSLQEQEKLKSVVTSILDTEEAHGSEITCVKTGTRDSNEENKEKDEDIEDFHRGLCENEIITESHLEEEVKQEEEITKEKLVEVVKTQNETENVPKISKEAGDKAPKVPEQNFLESESVNRSLQEKEKLKCVVTSILDTEEAHGSEITCVKTGSQDSNEEINSSTAEFHKDRDHPAGADDTDNETIRNEGLLDQDSKAPEIDIAARDPPKGLDENVICESSPTNTVHKIMMQQQEEDSTSKHDILPLPQVQQGKESVKQNQTDEICSSDKVQAKDEENIMLSTRKSEEENKAYPWSKPKGDEDVKTYLEAVKVDDSSLSKGILEVPINNDAQDVPKDSEDSATKNKSSEEGYPNKSKESQILTVRYEINLTEQASEDTQVTEVQEPKVVVDSQSAIPNATAVESQQVEEINDKCEVMAETKLQDLPGELDVRDCEYKMAEKGDPENLQNVEDINENVPGLNKGSIEASNKENPVRADVDENIKSSEGQQLGRTSKNVSDGGESCEEQETIIDKNEESRRQIDSISILPGAKHSDFETEEKDLPVHFAGLNCTDVTGLEVTLPSTDKHVVLEADRTKSFNLEKPNGDENIPAECSQGEHEVLKPPKVEKEEADCGNEERTDQETGKPESKETQKPSLSDLLQVSKGETSQMANLSATEKDPNTHREDQQAEKTDEAEHQDAKPDEEKDGEEKANEQKGSELSPEALVMVDMGDADVKVSHKKSHNILSGVGSKVKHSIAKVKKAITGKSSHPKPPSPKKVPACEK